ncbi:TPA_asm: hypothetical protein [Coelastrella green algae MELD virus]|nr:TPA_asm: hypothetical protein [Coelastrella green algae MELD virus]
MSIAIVLERSEPYKTSATARGRYAQRLQDDPAFREKNRLRVAAWREKNLERSRECTRLIMRRLAMEKKALASAQVLPEYQHKPRQRSSSRVKFTDKCV